MEEMIEARVPPQAVWAMWEKAHALYGEEGSVSGNKGKKKFKYKILNVQKGECFSILWKTLFVRLIFNHSVKPIATGSEIRYKVQIKGLFAWPIRWLVGEKIKNNLAAVLKAIVRELEH